MNFVSTWFEQRSDSPGRMCVLVANPTPEHAEELRYLQGEAREAAQRSIEHAERLNQLPQGERVSAWAVSSRGRRPVSLYAIGSFPLGGTLFRPDQFNTVWDIELQLDERIEF